MSSVDIGEPLHQATIAVVGCGAIGQFYAAQFILAGHEVRLLARRDVSTLAERGMIVHQTPTPKIASSARFPILELSPRQFSVASDASAWVDRRPADWVLVALKATALDQARGLVEPLLGSRTGVVVMCNGLGIEDRFAQWFGAKRTFGMLCYVGVHRGDDGIIRHAALGHVAVGHALDDPGESSRLRGLCESAGIECEINESLLEARWRKMAWNLPFNGLSLLFDCATDCVVGDGERRAFARQLAEEVVMLGNMDLAAHCQTNRIEFAWAEAQLRRTDAMGAYVPSTLQDARARRPLEWDPLFAEPARRAERLGASTPALKRLMGALRARGIGVG